MWELEAEETNEDIDVDEMVDWVFGEDCNDTDSESEDTSNTVCSTCTCMSLLNTPGISCEEIFSGNQSYISFTLQLSYSTYLGHNMLFCGTLAVYGSNWGKHLHPLQARFMYLSYTKAHNT